MFLIVPVMILVMTQQRTKEAVGEMVKDRRLALGLALNEAIAAAGVDPKTYASLEDGSRWPQERTRLRIETALKWQPGTIEALLTGQDPTELPDVEQFDSDVARLHAAIGAAIEAGDDEERSRLQLELAVVYETRGRFERSAQDAREAQQMQEWLALSFLADEVDTAATLSSPDAGDDDAVEDYIGEVDSLVAAANELTDAVHRMVLDAFDGDVAKLRQMKREVRRINMAKSQRFQPGLPVDDTADLSDQAEGRGAERLAALTTEATEAMSNDRRLHHADDTHQEGG